MAFPFDRALISNSFSTQRGTGQRPFPTRTEFFHCFKGRGEKATTTVHIQIAPIDALNSYKGASTRWMFSAVFRDPDPELVSGVESTERNPLTLGAVKKSGERPETLLLEQGDRRGSWGGCSKE